MILSTYEVAWECEEPALPGRGCGDGVSPLQEAERRGEPPETIRGPLAAPKGIVVARFVAIPVTMGDAFFLERDGRSVLVDGGNNVEGFPALFREHVNRVGADIVVCTHNDADHTNGIIGFLQAALRCREVWLPGRWLDTLPGLMRPWNEVAEDVACGAVEFWSEQEPKEPVEKPASIEEVGGMLSESCLKAEASENGSASDWPDEVGDAVDNQELTPPQWWDRWWRIYIPPPAGPVSDPRFWRIIDGALQAGERIRRIARLAYANGVPVRWFEYDPGRASGGLPGFLQVLSGRRIVRVSPYRTLFARLALTTVNKESLVLYSPSDHTSPGVLFCADSDLQRVSLPLRARDLVTAPHHGADANKEAYKAVSVSLPASASLTWVRSDCRTTTRPCPVYTKSLAGRRFCTVCRTGPPKQPVILIGRRSVWARHPQLRSCQC